MSPKSREHFWLELFLKIEEESCLLCISKCYRKFCVHSTKIVVGAPSQGMQEAQSNSSSLDIVSWTPNFSHSSLYAGCLVVWVCWWWVFLSLLCIIMQMQAEVKLYFVEKYLGGLIERMDISVFLIFPIQCFPASYVSLLWVFSRGCSPYVSPAFSQVRSWLVPVGH